MSSLLSLRLMLVNPLKILEGLLLKYRKITKHRKDSICFSESQEERT